LPARDRSRGKMNPAAMVLSTAGGVGLIGPLVDGRTYKR
jgi:hypothetical protein